jgi:superoxide dismutase, Cu-Zn family
MKPFTRMKLAGAGLVLAALTPGLSAEPTHTANAQLKDQNGALVGSADLMQTPAGLLIKFALKDIKAGQHAVHIHEVGKCEPPFESAGSHFNPEHRKHGFLAGEGHAGDLPNLHVPDGGKLEVEMMTKNATLEPGKPNSLIDRDGASLVIHAMADDYRSDPAGASGDRIACGVISSPSTVGAGSPRK